MLGNQQPEDLRAEPAYFGRLFSDATSRKIATTKQQVWKKSTRLERHSHGKDAHG